jgi:hypothetical protein
MRKSHNGGILHIIEEYDVLLPLLFYELPYWLGLYLYCYRKKYASSRVTGVWRTILFCHVTVIQMNLVAITCDPVKKKKNRERGERGRQTMEASADDHGHVTTRHGGGAPGRHGCQTHRQSVPPPPNRLARPAPWRPRRRALPPGAASTSPSPPVRCQRRCLLLPPAFRCRQRLQRRH